MRNDLFYVFVLFLTLLVPIQAQQITTNSSLPITTLVENNLTQECIEISNIVSTVNGDIVGIPSFGSFNKSTSNFPFESGIILSTGNINAAGNALNNNVLSQGNNGWSTDPDIESTLGISQTLNATSVEFNFVSLGSRIEFNYIFASEEYFGGFPCQNGDNFVALIKEAGPAGGANQFMNMAVVPGTTIPVSSDTVHDEIGGEGIQGFCAASNEDFFEGYNLGDTNYNGQTTVMTASAEVLPNVEYVIKIIIADQNDSNYDSAVFIEANSFRSSVNLGSEIVVCEDNFLLDANVTNPQASYSWFLNDTVITGETQSTLNAIQTGEYRVEINIPTGLSSSCFIEDTVSVTLSAIQSANPVTNYALCDDASEDGIELFDLSTKDEEILANFPESDYLITYHLSSEDAVNNVNSVTGNYQNTSNPQTIFVRVENTVSGCLAYPNFDLVVNVLPTISNPTTLVVCDSNNPDGFASINLAQKNQEITQGNFDLNVTYHFTQSDAVSGLNPIALPYTNTNTNEILFANVRNVNTGCSVTTSLELVVFNSPIINTNRIIIGQCDTDLDGFSSFDITSVIDDVLQGVTGVSVSYHATQNNAASGTNPIANPSNYTNTTNSLQNVFIRVEDVVNGCASIKRVELHTNVLLTATAIGDFDYCDFGNDGNEDINFNQIENSILNNLPAVVGYPIDIEFYTSENDRDNQINPIDTSSPIALSADLQTIFITLTSATCQEVSEFDLILNPIAEFNDINDQVICDTDQDGLTTINLSVFDALVTNNQLAAFSVDYFASEANANAGSNRLPNSYTNTSSTFTLYTNVISNDTGCFDVTSFEIEVLPAPLSSQPTSIIICDEDQDGVSIIDLNTKIPETVTDTTNRIISFHNSQNDASNGSNSITNPEIYPATTETIFIRVENTFTGCFSIENFGIIINTLPVITSIERFAFCDSTNDDFGEFLFSSQDSDILNGQIGKEVFYFETEVDAENNTNPIDKNNIYINLTNPQTIFYRVENITDTNCFATSSFEIEVGTIPLFGEPSDIFVCDDVSNNGTENFDFSSQITEITDGFPDIQEVTLHASRFDAENNVNPLPINFDNTVNPQEIYARISNGQLCDGYTSFVVNVINRPELNETELTQCDVDYDGIVVFDLTASEDDLLDERLDSIEISYFESEEDLLTGSNEIQDPTNYTNLSNPQTVYVLVSNTFSDCFSYIPLHLNVNLPPIINPITEFSACTTESGSTNLTSVNRDLLQQTTNVLVDYYSSEDDAINEINVLDNNYQYNTNNDLLFARVAFSTTGCFVIHSFNLNISPLPTANTPGNLEACDDDNDGFFEFDLSQQDSEILGTQNPNEFTVSYYLNMESAEEGGNDIGHTYFAVDNETIYARVENSVECYSITQFTTVVFEKPSVAIDDQYICLENLPLIVSANTNNSNDTYFWSTNETTPEIEITQIGTYSVTVTTLEGCSTTSVFTVSESEAANIDVVETIDFSNPNNITVTVSGIGNYLYQLDDNLPQISNVFENVSLGNHIITIIDINGCSQVVKEVTVIDTPKFMTPNGDGFFDTWHITGVQNLPGTVVYIFDRYGKLLQTLSHNSAGWDGTFNGSLMPASDYWFIADVKKDNTQFQVKGHFALRLGSR